MNFHAIEDQAMGKTAGAGVEHSWARKAGKPVLSDRRRHQPPRYFLRRLVPANLLRAGSDLARGRGQRLRASLPKCHVAVAEVEESAAAPGTSWEDYNQARAWTGKHSDVPKSLLSAGSDEPV